MNCSLIDLISKVCKKSMSISIENISFCVQMILTRFGQSFYLPEANNNVMFMLPFYKMYSLHNKIGNV